MRDTLSRRHFLATSAATAGAFALGKAQAAPFNTCLKKSLIGSPNEKTLTEWKAAGFDGIEVSRQWDVPIANAVATRKLAEIAFDGHSLPVVWLG